MNPRVVGPRDRLLASLDVLGAQRSVLDVGIDDLLRHAGVAKASLYHHFGSKEELVAAWLDARQLAWFGWLGDHLRLRCPGAQPRKELDGAFGFLEAWLDRDDFSGCPFVSTYVQVKDARHPAGERARAYGSRLLEFFRTRLSALGDPTAASTAAALLGLFLGTVIVGQLAVAPSPARSARLAAARIVAKATGPAQGQRRSSADR
jgi:AcrR family transcriptional regulator